MKLEIKRFFQYKHDSVLLSQNIKYLNILNSMHIGGTKNISILSFLLSVAPPKSNNAGWKAEHLIGPDFLVWAYTFSSKQKGANDI